MLNLQHQTPAEFLARFRSRYRNSSGEECARLATWLYSRYQAGDVTAAQIRTAFDKDAVQFSAFVTKVQALREHWLAVQEAQGE